MIHYNKNRTPSSVSDNPRKVLEGPQKTAAERRREMCILRQALMLPFSLSSTYQDTPISSLLPVLQQVMLPPVCKPLSLQLILQITDQSSLYQENTRSPLGYLLLKALCMCVLKNLLQFICIMLM